MTVPEVMVIKIGVSVYWLIWQTFGVSTDRVYSQRDFFFFYNLCFKESRKQKGIKFLEIMIQSVVAICTFEKI